jgi:integrating conjugative element protein (TIGR03757 family)
MWGSTMTVALATPARSRRPGWPPLLAFCYAFLAATGVCAADILVITDQQHPTAVAPGIRLIELDLPSRIQAELSAQLPSEPIQAAAIVQQRLKDGGAELQRRLRDAYQGVADAWSLGVLKIPAVVVDQRYVVYGEADADRALARIEAYRRARP